MNPLQKFLIRFKKKGSENITHTIIPGSKTNITEIDYGTSLTVCQDNLDEFNNYIHYIIFNENKSFPLTESFSENTPLILDLDILYENVEQKRYYTDETLKQLCNLIYKQITYYFECLNGYPEECWINEKTRPTFVDGNVKDGLHIIFPNIIGKTKIFKEFIKRFYENEEVCEEIIEIFRNTSVDNIIPSNDVNKIFDSNVQRWFVYGCGKPDKEPYLLTKIIDCVENKFIENIPDTKTIMDKVCIVKEREENITYKHDIDNVLKNNLRTSSSVSTFDMEHNLTDEEDPDYNPYFDNIEDVLEVNNRLKEDKIKEIRDYVLKCLSIDRANEYELWIKLGMCLKNIGGEKLFGLWDDFSQRGDNYEGEEECRKKWNSFKNCSNPLTEGTLKWWAKMDNENAFTEIKENNLITRIDTCIREGGAHDDIANVVYCYFEDEFICADLKDLWFHFDGNKWVQCSKGYKLHQALPNKIKRLFLKAVRNYQDKQVDNEDTQEVEILMKREESAQKIYTKLKDVSFNENIMKACKLKFYKEKIMEIMDSNTKLLGFDNCVFDLEENIIREGRPEDYISMTTKINLPILPNELPITPDELWNRIPDRVGKYKTNRKNEKVWNHEKWDNGDKRFFKMVHNDISKFFKEILPDPQIRKYCMRFIASRLCGDVLEQRFSIWTGCGGNGKSILIDIIRHSFGEYCINIPVTLLTQKRKASNAACPEKARTRGVRMCYMQEPDSGERINAGEMKELSGGDMIQARKLYSDIFEFKPQFEIVLMCNEKPTIDDKTNGAWRRVQVYPFVSRFVDDDKQINPENNVYKRDKVLPTKLEHWRIIFMCMLMKEWVSMGGGIDEDSIPDIIRMETENYKNQNDIVGQWISEDLKITGENIEPITFNELFNAFENWFSDNHNNEKKVDKITIKRRLIDWQKKSKFTFTEGYNGTERHPKFNLMPLEE